MGRGLRHLTVLVLLALPADRLGGADHPLSAERRTGMAKQFRETVDTFTARIKADPTRVSHFSRRGDAYLFLGRFAEAVSDYEKMIALDPKLKPFHWRLGIAYFYAKKYKQAADQFEVYYTHDDVDRENGIWRFLSQAKADGIEAAQAGLLKYTKVDREPFPAVYDMFAGKMTPEAVLEQIRSAEINKAEREKRLFYAHLYVGLLQDVRGKPKSALANLRTAVENTWAPGAGFGPRYMWQVGRLHYELLTEK